MRKDTWDMMMKQTVPGKNRDAADSLSREWETGIYHPENTESPGVRKPGLI